jgi:hypothetical protein
VLLLYAVLPVGAMVPEGMSRVDGTDVGVAFSEVQGPPPPEQAELVRFGEMVARLSATGALLPFRFGTVVEDREALEGLVAEREAEWLERLGAVRNKVEMVVHAERPATPAPDPPLTGREYVMSRVARVREHDQLVSALTLAVGDLASELRELRTTDGLRLAVLLPQGRVTDLCAALDEWQAEEPGRAAWATGPWPPFSFSSSEVAS